MSVYRRIWIVHIRTDIYRVGIVSLFCRIVSDRPALPTSKINKANNAYIDIGLYMYMDRYGLESIYRYGIDSLFRLIMSDIPGFSLLSCFTQVWKQKSNNTYLSPQACVTSRRGVNPKASVTSWRRVSCPLWRCWDVASPCPCAALWGFEWLTTHILIWVYR